VGQSGEQLAPGEVAGGAEENDHVRSGRLGAATGGMAPCSRIGDRLRARAGGLGHEPIIALRHRLRTVDEGSLGERDVPGFPEKPTWRALACRWLGHPRLRGPALSGSLWRLAAPHRDVRPQML
jgi:hypothetical protein